MSNHPNTNPTSDEPPKKAGLKNRFLSVLGKILLGTLVCLILVLIMGRVYFSDDRIKSLATQKLSEAIHTDVEIRSLDINLLEGIQIDGVTIHAPKSFSKPPLAFEKFIIEWDIVALLDLHIKLAKVILVKPSLNFEENAAAQILKHF